MKAFIAAIVVAIVLGAGAAGILGGLDMSSAKTFVTTNVRL